MSGVEWREWTAMTFQEARKKKKPILLNLTAVWCHWCHVNMRENFSNPEIISVVNEWFIPVKVDIDERPDIRDRYHQGGFPTTAFLTPDGEMFFGATYLPPPQLLPLLRQLAQDYQAQRIHLPSSTPPFPSPAPHLTEGIAQEMLATIRDHFDRDFGGFGFEPKFPQTEVLDFLMFMSVARKDKSVLYEVNKTLEQMGKGGLYDPVEGGFFRYSTTQDWSVPHFEKMLEGNAGLLLTYLHAYQLTGIGFYKEIAQGILRYVRTFLSDHVEGGFYGSQDADEDYYQLSAEDRKKRSAPFIDRRLYTHWNAQMVSSYLKAGLILDDPAYTAFALKTLNRLLDMVYDPRTGMRHVSGTTTPVDGLLADQLWMLHALLDAFELTHDGRYLGAVKELATHLESYYDASHGGFFDRLPRPDDIGILKTREKPLMENALAVRVLLRLRFHLHNESDMAQAEATLKALLPLVPQYSFLAAPYAFASELFTQEPTKVEIKGHTTDPEVQKILAIANAFYDPRKVVLFEEADTRQVFLCLQTVCLPPLAGPDELMKALHAQKVPA